MSRHEVHPIDIGDASMHIKKRLPVREMTSGCPGHFTNKQAPKKAGLALVLRTYCSGAGQPDMIVRYDRGVFKSFARTTEQARGRP